MTIQTKPNTATMTAIVAARAAPRTSHADQFDPILVYIA